MLRKIVREQQNQTPTIPSISNLRPASPLGSSKKPQTVIAFIKTTSDAVIQENGCHSLARFGNIHIASIPTDRLAPLSLDSRVLRIEAWQSKSLTTDSMAVHLNATQAYTGQGLPQAYTGRGVVMGIMDVGFDLTHPTFYSRDTTDYRIRRFWDQLSQDTVGSPFPVGRDFTTRNDILAVAHSRDGMDITHGTHTTGIAAGSGYDSEYRGMAPESDICLVANAVSDDLPYIDSTDVYKYTYATDALGFKYIFDYAQSVGKPCVISFSEGSPQDFWGYDQLYYEILDSLTGPGRILVVAAGNEGHHTSWIHKPRGKASAGSFLQSGTNTMTVTLKSPDDFSLRMVCHAADNRDTLLLSPAAALEQPDSTLTTQLPPYELTVEAYPSCYDSTETCYDLTVASTSTIGVRPPLSLEMLGAEADVELWRQSGRLVTNTADPRLSDGEPTHNILSPASAPCAICVGGTSYRDYIVNLSGDTMTYWGGTGGMLFEPSSHGPTMDGRMKPDCLAPGNNIISSYSSYYLESHPTAGDIQWDVAHFPFQGRTYVWNSNSGTSMASPAAGGAIALWLQACPTLTPDDILGVLKRTSRHYDPTLAYPNNYYGYGEIDVYAGLLDILGLAEISDIPQRHTDARITIHGNMLTVTLPQAAKENLPLRVYDLSGKPIHIATIPKGSTTFTTEMSRLPSGICAVCVGNTSTLIRQH